MKRNLWPEVGCFFRSCCRVSVGGGLHCCLERDMLGREQREVDTVAEGGDIFLRGERRRKRKLQREKERGLPES